MDLTLKLKDFLKERDNFKLELNELIGFGKQELPELSSHQRYNCLHDMLKELEASNDIVIPDSMRLHEPISQLPFYIIDNNKSKSEYRDLEKRRRNYIRENVNWVEKLRYFCDDGNFHTKIQIDTALKLNEYFLNPSSLQHRVTINYRSLEIFGDETTLGKVFQSQIFKDIFTEEDFNIYRVEESLVSLDAVQPLKSDIASVLICDTKEAWSQCARLNAELGIFASVIFMNARQMVQKCYVVDSLNDKLDQCHAQRIYYWGSLDLSKLKLPSKGNRLRKKYDSVEILPYIPLYRALFEHGIAVPKVSNTFTQFSNNLSEWLGEFYHDELEDGLVVYEWASCGLKDKDIINNMTPIT